MCSVISHHLILNFIEFLILSVSNFFNFPLEVQPKPGVISSVGGMTLGKGGMQIQVLGTSLTQMPAPQPPAPVQTQVKT